MDLIYEASIEGMYLKGHPDKLTPHVKQVLREIGIDLDQKLKPAYPVPLVHQATRTFRKLAYGHEADDMKAYVAMGSAIIDGYFNTIIGKAMAGVLKLIGFKKVIDRLPSAMTSGSSYQTVTVSWKAPNEAHVTVSDIEPHPGLTLGVLRRGFTHWFGAKGVSVELHEHAHPAATYRISWPA